MGRWFVKMQRATARDAHPQFFLLKFLTLCSGHIPGCCPHVPEPAAPYGSPGMWDILYSQATQGLQPAHAAPHGPGKEQESQNSGKAADLEENLVPEGCALPQHIPSQARHVSIQGCFNPPPPKMLQDPAPDSSTPLVTRAPRGPGVPLGPSGPWHP